MLHERDAYLAWCLRRSKAVNGAKYVVGVVGFGHLRGITYHLMQDSVQLQFKDLAGLTGKGKQAKESEKRDWRQTAVTVFGLVTGLWWARSLFVN